MIVVKVDGKEITLSKDQALAYSDPGLRDLIATIRLAELGKLVTAGKPPEKVTAAFLADETEAASSTVRDRLHRLVKHKMLIRKEDKTYTLTDAGRELADALLEEEKRTPKAREAKKDE